MCWRKGPRPLCRAYTHKHTHTLTLTILREWTNIFKKYGHEKCLHRWTNVSKRVHTAIHRLAKAVRPICTGTVNPSRSLAPGCQGELRKLR